MNDFISAEEMHLARNAAFWSECRPTCHCLFVELREEGGMLRCAVCDAPVVPRRPR